MHGFLSDSRDFIQLMQDLNRAPSSLEAATNDKRVNILLVDDRIENLRTLKAILGPLDQNIVEARSGREALKCLLDQEFAVVLLDVMMPDMDGFETATIIRERDKSRLTPIIFVTAMLMEETHAFRGYSIGAVDYIMKPFIPEILRSKVSVFVELFKKSEQVKMQAKKIRAIEQREFENHLAEARNELEREAERSATEQRITQAVVHHAPIGILRLNSTLGIAEVNPVFCEQFNLGKNISNDQLASVILPWLPESLIESVKKGEPYRINELKVCLSETCNEAQDKYWDFATWPIKDILGNVLSTVVVAMDVTERVQLNEQRKDFVGTLAHDLQTPVIASDRALELLLNRLGKQHLEPDLIELVSMLKRNNQNLLHMIQSLLDIYHYEMGAKALNFDQIDVGMLATTCIEELTPLATEQNRTLNCHIEDDVPKIWADRTGIRRVITNLLDNAIKFTKDGGSVQVNIAGKEQEVLITVIDNGIGISVDDQSRLFERFWHRSEHKSFKSSSGLGLYLCKQIIEAHAGNIECVSELGRTTSFIVSLPAILSKTVEESKQLSAQ